MCFEAQNITRFKPLVQFLKWVDFDQEKSSKNKLGISVIAFTPI